MIPELGHFALVITLVLALIQATVPMVGALRGYPVLQAYGRTMATGQFVFASIAFLCLVFAFVTDDFSVRYAASNSNSLLPWYFKVSAVWGGHEGSLLLWALILAGWGFAVACFSKQLPDSLRALVLSIMGMISVGFLLFILITSNPFLRLLPGAPADGADLNPLLQDVGLIMHPPMLYMGYVGFSVAFAFAVAALISGRLDAAWARWSRPWTTVAWAFLTVGIALGSWWAYYELGWGGWWFWDPVENASFMPWLAGTALMHSLAVTEKRGVFKAWTVLLAILTFSLSLLGTFLVRSGILTSVHAFANDPARGQFVLTLLGITVGGSLLLFALRAPTVRSTASYGLFSRETFLLLNNVLLITAMFAVLLGTLFPLIFDLFGLGSISVGAPWFNAVFVPIMVVLVLVMVPGMFTHWRQTPLARLTTRLRAPALGGTLFAVLLPYLSSLPQTPGTALGVFLGGWLITATLIDLRERIAHPQGMIVGWKRLTRSYLGMVFGHLGIAITVIGVTMVSLHSSDRDVRMEPGDVTDVAGYEFRFEGSRVVAGINYQATRARFSVYRHGKRIAYLNPEKRLYQVKQSMMTEAAIGPGLFRDLYIAMGEPLEGNAWALRIQVKPYVRWIWLGALFMGFGGVLAVSDRRYRQRVASKTAKPANDIAATTASRNSALNSGKSS